MSCAPWPCGEGSDYVAYQALVSEPHCRLYAVFAPLTRLARSPLQGLDMTTCASEGATISKQVCRQGRTCRARIFNGRIGEGLCNVLSITRCGPVTVPSCMNMQQRATFPLATALSCPSSRPLPSHPGAGRCHHGALRVPARCPRRWPRRRGSPGGCPLHPHLYHPGGCRQAGGVGLRHRQQAMAAAQRAPAAQVGLSETNQSPA